MYSIPPGGYHETVKAHNRRIFARVIIDYTDPFKDEGVHVYSMSDTWKEAFLPQITDGKKLPSAKWASLDGSWSLDGTWALAPVGPTMQVGFWGEMLSDENGWFKNSYGDAMPVRIGLAFTSPQRIDKLAVAGDILRGEYPVNFFIEFRDAAGSLMPKTVFVQENDQVFWEQDIEPLLGVKHMELWINKWSHPGRQAKIVEFVTALQEIYEGEELISIKLLEEREVSGGSLPVGNISANEIEITLNNADRKFSAGNVESPLYGMLRANRRIRAWLGVDVQGEIGAERVWVPLGVFWSGDWHSPEDAVYAKTTGRDRLELLRSTNYSTSQVLVADPEPEIPEIIFARDSPAIHPETGESVPADAPIFLSFFDDNQPGGGGLG